MLLLLACAGPAPSSDDTAAVTGPTWHQDVAPIVTKSCSGCHQDGQVGPFPLTTYAEVSAVGGAVADSVADRRMPPWQADPTCNTYRHDPSLSDAEIATIQAWVDAGMPEGDAETAAALTGPDAATLTRVDHTLQLPSPYTPRNSPDDYRCFLVDWPVEESVYVTGYTVRPGNPEIVHHVIAYLAPPDQVAEYEALDAAEDGEGWTCFGGPGAASQEDAEWLGGWAPGASNGDFPNGTGIGVDAGSKIVLQVHYNTAAAEAAPDQSEIDFMVEDEVENPAIIQPWTDPSWLYGNGMLIPAGESGVEHSFSYTMPEGVEFRIHTANLHMHQLGQTARLSLTDADGNEDCLLSIQDWDFNWQRTYVLEEPVTVDGGTLTVTCTWDNPTDADVAWGEGTGDEMCLGTMLWSY